MSIFLITKITFNFFQHTFNCGTAVVVAEEYRKLSLNIMERNINLDSELYSPQPIPFQPGQSNEEETLFDAGCGPGGTTVKFILPLIPRLKKSSLEHFENQITKFVSVYCFQWLKDPRKGFENVFRLLKPGGEAASTCVLQSSYYSAFIEMHNNNPAWTNLFQNVDHLSTFQKYKYDGADCNKIAEDIGFECSGDLDYF
ncbi:UNVERIFIED_CONTAM: hypothetical protein NCL1_52931 [Trichonephila clavipes]